jgi:flagellar assembly factor FliW
MSTSLSFVTPPPGFAPLTDFTLDDIEGASGLYSLRAVGNDSIRLFVLDAAVYVPHYAPELSDEQCGALGVSTPEDAIVLVVANPGENGTSMNLMAPIVVNSRTGASAQFILENQDWPLRAELAARSA